MQKAIKKSVYIKPTLNEKIIKYISQKSTKNGKAYSYSEVVNEALEKLLDIEATNRSLELTTQIITKAIETEMRKYNNKMSDMVVKNLITTYTIEELLARVILISYTGQVKDEKNFVKELLEDSRATSVKILKSKSDDEIKKILDKIL